MFGGADLTEGKFVMVPIVQNIHQIGIEGVNVLLTRELGEDHLQPIVKVLLRVLDLFQGWQVSLDKDLKVIFDSYMN